MEKLEFHPEVANEIKTSYS